MNKSHFVRTLRRSLALTLLGSLLSACGGGGDTPAPLSAAGLYESTGSGRAFEVLLLDTGRSYAIYGMTSAAAVPVAGVIVADVAVNGSSFASSNVHDFNIESHTLNTGTMAGTFVAKTSIAATTITSGSTGTSFGASYDVDYEQSPSRAALAGSYAGETADIAGSKASVFTLDASGVLAGSTTAGCSYAGLVTTHSSGNVFDLSVTFQSGCADAGNTLKGHAFVSQNVLYAVVVNSDLSRAVVLAGLKS